jgi:Rrf2 family nitric oxide-sensitive transcriptional repressor
MQLTLHADYALRVLLYLGTQPAGHIATTKQISSSYGISNDHLVRVVRTLKDKGYVEVMAGRSGGISLAQEPNRIRLGDVVHQVETNLQIVECFDPKTNTCPIIAACQLKPVLAEALNAFLEALNKYTLADLLDDRRRSRLARIFAATGAH